MNHEISPWVVDATVILLFMMVSSNHLIGRLFVSHCSRNAVLKLNTRFSHKLIMDSCLSIDHLYWKVCRLYFRI